MKKTATRLILSRAFDRVQKSPDLFVAGSAAPKIRGRSRDRAPTSMHSLSKLIKKELVIGLPKLNFEKDRICDAYQLGKQIKVSFKSKNIILTSRPLELLYMNLFGPTRTTSLDEKRYGFVIIDDFSHFT